MSMPLNEYLVSKGVFEPRHLRPGLPSNSRTRGQRRRIRRRAVV